MIITKQNAPHINRAIANLLSIDITLVSTGADPEDNLVIFNPEEHSLNSSEIEAEVQAVFEAWELEQLRIKRNELLAETDWWVLPDRTPTQTQLDYRQALRDITDSYSSIADVVWPDKP